MKIHITENIEKIIDGYNMIPIIYGKVDLNKIPDNAATEIIAIDAIDSIPHSLLGDFLNQIVRKMRFGCNLILGGVELGLIGRNLINGKLNSENFNELLSSKKSMHSSKDIVDILNQYKLVINNINIRGNNYEITASRPANKN